MLLYYTTELTTRNSHDSEKANTFHAS